MDSITWWRKLEFLAVVFSVALVHLCWERWTMMRLPMTMTDGSKSPAPWSTNNDNNTTASLSQDHVGPRRRSLLFKEEEERPGGRPLKILYTITTLSEYDEGSRATSRGTDRLKTLLIPIMKEGVDSMLSSGYEVDVCIVSHYTMTREHLIREALKQPPGHRQVKLMIWDNASPINYDPGTRDDPRGKLRVSTMALSRQHRFVIKDHLFEYDFFCNFEDDMLIKGEHIENYLELTKQLFRLRDTAPDAIDPKYLSQASFFGKLTKSQLKRIFPGLMRVEALLEEKRFGAQTRKDPVPIAEFHDQLDPKPCCHLSNFSVSESRPAAPSMDKLFIWETGITSLGVRHIPTLGWVMFQRGPKAREGEFNVSMKDYWSGTNKAYGGGKMKRPSPGAFDQINNQGGWMATRQQIWEWHTEICPGGFLPPFDAPHYNYDGLDMRNVEYWSGGLNLYTHRHACNMQRIVSLDPQKFVRHLIYHTSNNKQRQLHGKFQRFVKVNDLYGQLLTVQNDANTEMNKRLPHLEQQ